MTNIAIGLRDFIPLAPGEFDVRSTGGAYIHGSRFGQLTFACGPQNIVTDKVREEIAGRTGLWKLTHGGSLTNNSSTIPPMLPAPDNTQFRIGDVKRQLLPTDFTDSSPNIPGNPAVPGREYYIHVDQPLLTLNPLVADLTYDLRVGSVWRDGPVPTFTPNGFQESLSTTALDLYSFEVDLLGNITTSAGLKYALNAPIVSISGGLSTTVTSGGPTNVDGALVQLGAQASAIHPGVHGDILIALFTAIAAGLSAVPTPITGTAAGSVVSLALATVLAASGASNLISPKVFLE